jgi:hypothetical protein
VWSRATASHPGAMRNQVRVFLAGQPCGLDDFVEYYQPNPAGGSTLETGGPGLPRGRQPSRARIPRAGRGTVH